MRLKINTNPKVDVMEFSTRSKKHVESPSPRSVLKQRGLEFEKFRAYQPNEDASLIDWRASARAGETLVRVYSEDIALNILIVIDVTESMIYGTSKKAKIEYAVELAINIAYGAISYGDRVGAAIFNETIVDAVKFDTGTNHFSEIAARISDSRRFGGKINFEQVLGNIVEMFKDTHLMILISDFIGFGDKLHEDLYTIIDKFDILGIMVNDKSDVYLDSHFYMYVSDPYSGKKDFAIPHLKEYYIANKERINNLENFFENTENELWFLYTTDPIEKIMELNEKRNAMEK